MSGQDMIRQLTAELEAANERAKVAEAEVAGWRRAVRWERQGNDSYTLRLAPAESKPRYDLGGVTEYRDGWMAWRGGGRMQGPSPDRNTACAKVCELLGIPTVLPGGE